MPDRGRVDVRLTTQILLLQVVVVTLTLVTAFGLFAEFNRHRLVIQYEIRALDIARVVASAPAVRANISRYDAAARNPIPALVNELAAGPLQSVAALVKRRTECSPELRLSGAEFIAWLPGVMEEEAQWMAQT